MKVIPSPQTKCCEAPRENIVFVLLFLWLHGELFPFLCLASQSSLLASSTCFVRYGEVKSPQRALSFVVNFTPSDCFFLQKKRNSCDGFRSSFLCLACLVRAALVRSSHSPPPPYYAGHASFSSAPPFLFSAKTKQSNLRSARTAPGGEVGCRRNMAAPKRNPDGTILKLFVYDRRRDQSDDAETVLRCHKENYGKFLNDVRWVT